MSNRSKSTKASQNVRMPVRHTPSFGVYRSGGVEKKRKKGGTGGKRRREGGEADHRARSKDRMKKANRMVAASLVADNSVHDVRGLTKRDALFVSNVLKGMPKGEAMQLAARAIGVTLSESTAQAYAGTALQKPQVDSAIVHALEAAGVDDKLIAGKIRDGLDATAFTQTGIEHDDFKTRLGYIHTVLKVKGQIGAEVANQQQVLNYTSFKEED